MKNSLVTIAAIAVANVGSLAFAQNDNSFNPQISLILDGSYADYDNDPEDYSIPGFTLGPEAGLAEEGFSIGHSELVMSANIDNNFYGKTTIAIAEHDGETEIELEEAFVQTLGLADGFAIKFGRFYSEFGYLNIHHQHAWDFADAPLPYRAFFGDKLLDDGLQLSYIAPTDLYMEVTAEFLSGKKFPAGGNDDGGIGAGMFSVSFGGDIDESQSWLLGFSHWQATDITERTGSGHDHGGATEIPSFDGERKLNGIDFVYKWAPNGNPKEEHFKFVLEYFDRSEDGDITLIGSSPLETSTYDGDQSGWYVQAVYKFKPHWRTGIRFDQLESDNTGSDPSVLDEASLIGANDDPKRASIMVEWVPSEFSRIRLQYNDDQSSPVDDKQLIMQYTFSLGSHGAHQF